MTALRVSYHYEVNHPENGWTFTPFAGPTPDAATAELDQMRSANPRLYTEDRLRLIEVTTTTTTTRRVIPPGSSS